MNYVLCHIMLMPYAFPARLDLFHKVRTKIEYASGNCNSKTVRRENRLKNKNEIRLIKR